MYKCGIKGRFEETSEKAIWVSKKPVSVTAVEEIRDVYTEILKCEANGLVRIKTARFFKEKFPQAWDYAFSHPGARQKIIPEWEQKQAKNSRYTIHSNIR